MLSRSHLVTLAALASAAAAAGAAGYLALRPELVAAQSFQFQLVEATIDDVHRAIREGQISCRALVQEYVDRARAYNGTTTEPLTEEMAQAGFFPQYAEYKAAVDATASLPLTDPRKTLPLEFGRVEATASDPEVQQQYGMVVGVPESGQVRALNTLNVRGERSVTCKGAFDTAPSTGSLPAGAPAVCEEFRKQPDALERAAELDAQFGRNPDLSAMPMYCIPFSFKDAFDTKDMRSTAGADAGYDIDFTARDHTLVATLRDKGAIIYAKANLREYNGGGGDPGGEHQAATVFMGNAGPGRSSWGGNPGNVYDTSRAPSLGSSSGSGVSVSANLVMCSLCEETRQSCRGPANHNGSALLLPQKAGLSFLGGGIGADIYNDRTGIICRNITDAAKVYDALAHPEYGYYDPRDIFTSVAPSSRPDTPLASALGDGAAGSLKGMRIGIVREFMIPHAKIDEPFVQGAAREMKDVLAKHLGATLVESPAAGWTDDPDVEDMTVSFDRALAELTPVLFPQLLYRVSASGAPEFPDFAKAIEPTAFQPGVTLGEGEAQPVDWMIGWAEGTNPAPKNLNLRSMLGQELSRNNRFHMSQYLIRRARDWNRAGFTETLDTFSELNERSKFFSANARAAFMNWASVRDLRNPLGSRQGISEQVQMRELLRRVIAKVMAENDLDALVNLHTSMQPAKIGGATEPSVGDRAVSYPMGPNAGITEILIPAGFVRTVYDPVFELATSPEGRKFYRGVSSNVPTELPAPGLPFSLSFWAEPGDEPTILKVASSYEAGSKRRVPPPAFGPLAVAP